MNVLRSDRKYPATMLSPAPMLLIPGTGCQFGMAAGAATLLRPGTEPCRRDDAERLYRQMEVT